LLMRVGRWAVSVFLNECWKLFANRDCASIHVSTFWNLISVYTLSFLGAPISHAWLTDVPTRWLASNR
jgi:hypothetical protein